MPILNPDHLLEQAERLVAPPPHGPPRQVDLRRAVSAAYYALFHRTATALADEFAGARWRSQPRYYLIYRSLDHRTFRDVCAVVRRPTQRANIRASAPLARFGSELETYAETVIELQQRRHAADYDPAGRYKTADALNAIRTAQGAMVSFNGAPSRGRQMLLTLLLCNRR